MLKQNIKTIVVGTDFSDYSKIIVRQARLLSKLWKAGLMLVYVIPDEIVYAPAIYVPFPDRLDNEYYEKEIRTFYGVGRNSPIQVKALRGFPAEVLMEVADRFSDSMIMAGYRGIRPIAEFFFGSTAQSLVLKSKHPVWIHRGRKVVNPEKILIPHDLSNESDTSIDMVNNLSLATPAKFEVFYVDRYPLPVLDYTGYSPEQVNRLGQMSARVMNLKNEYPGLHFEAATGQPDVQIRKKAKKFDLIVMTHHQHQGFFNKSKSVDIFKHVNKPALIVQ